MERVIQYLGSKATVVPKELSTALQEVNVIVQDLLEKIGPDVLQQLGDQFTLHKELMGSVAEETKVNEADEFDFLFVLKPKKADIFRVQSAEYMATKLAYNPKSYCHVTADNQEGWNSDFLNNEQLLPNKLYEHFFKAVQTHSSDSAQGSPCFPVEQKGPAVAIYLYRQEQQCIVKVDLSLALQITRSTMETCLAKRQSILRLPPPVSDCDTFHVICAGSFWKLSVSWAAREYMKRLSKETKTLYKALKVVSEKDAVTQAMEDGQMGSYPIKVAIMHQVEGIPANEHKRGLYITGLNVLHSIDHSPGPAEFRQNNAVQQMSEIREPESDEDVRIHQELELSALTNTANTGVTVAQTVHVSAVIHSSQNADSSERDPENNASSEIQISEARQQASIFKYHFSNKSDTPEAILSEPTCCARERDSPSTAIKITEHVTPSSSLMVQNIEDESPGNSNFQNQKPNNQPTGQMCLTSFMIVDDPIFKESDKSSTHARKMTQTIRKIDDGYDRHGASHTILFVPILTILAMALWMSISLDHEQHVIFFLLLVVCLLISIFGLAVAGFSKCSKYDARASMRNQAIYLHSNILLFNYALIISICLVTLISRFGNCYSGSDLNHKSVFRYNGSDSRKYPLSITYHYNSSDSNNYRDSDGDLYRYSDNNSDISPVNDSNSKTGMAAKHCYPAIYSVSFVFCICLLHIIITIIHARCNLRRHRWEWIFCDQMYISCLRKGYKKVRRIIP